MIGICIVGLSYLLKLKQVLVRRLERMNAFGDHLITYIESHGTEGVVELSASSQIV